MTRPELSIVVPMLNEEPIVDTLLSRVSLYLESRETPWEIIVVDDGSSDGTAARVQAWSSTDARIRIAARPHGGKGAAVRHGMMMARGRWRLMADSDLSVTPQGWSVLFDAAREPDGAEVIVASREAAGARRVGEPLVRHLIGRVFNWMVQLFLVRGINDTQCGFKLFSEAAATTLFPRLTIGGFAFDVELLFLAHHLGLRTREVGVVWTCRRGSRVVFRTGAVAFLDVLRIRCNHVLGRYAALPASTPGMRAGRDLDRAN